MVKSGDVVGQSSKAAEKDAPPKLIDEPIDEERNPNPTAISMGVIKGLASVTGSLESFATAEEEEGGAAIDKPEGAEPAMVHDEAEAPTGAGEAETSAEAPTGADPDAGQVPEQSAVKATESGEAKLTKAQPSLKPSASDKGKGVVEIGSESGESSPPIPALKRKRLTRTSRRLQDVQADAPAPPTKKKKQTDSVQLPTSGALKAHQPRTKRFRSEAARERYNWFSSRGIIEERLVELDQEDEWGYVEIIKTGGMSSTVTNLARYGKEIMAEFYANLPTGESEDQSKGVKVHIRGYDYAFSPELINRYLGFEELSETEVEADEGIDSISTKKLARFLTEGNSESLSTLTTKKLPPKFAVLVLIAACNWIPSSHRSHISTERARLLYKMAKGIRFDFGQMVYRQVMKVAEINESDPRWLVFPRIIYGLLAQQRELVLFAKEKLIQPVVYKKDPRSGEGFVKKEAVKAVVPEKKVKSVRAQTEDVQRPASVQPSAQQSESSTPTECTQLVHLGSIRVPEGPASRGTIYRAIVGTQLALHRLGDICLQLSQSLGGGEEDEDISGSE